MSNFHDTDYEKVRTVHNAFKDFRQDLETFDAFSNFDYKSLESYKLEKLVLSQEPPQRYGAKTRIEQAIAFNPGFLSPDD